MLAASSKNASFESSSHYEDINVTSKEYAMKGVAGGMDSCSDGGGGVRRIKYPKVLPDFPAQCSGAERRLSLPPPMAGIPEGGGATKIPPPPPPRVSSTLGRKSKADTNAMKAVPFNKQLQPDTIPEEHKSLVVPCVPNKVCPAAAVTATAPSVRKPVEPRIVIKASSVQQQNQHQQPNHHQPNQQQQQQKQPKRTNIPRVVHPQNSDRINKIATGTEAAGDTSTVKRKKK